MSYENKINHSSKRHQHFQWFDVNRNCSATHRDFRRNWKVLTE